MVVFLGPLKTKRIWFLFQRVLFQWDNDNENDAESGDTDEAPVHEVFLHSYYIDRYEVNASDFSSFLNKYPSKASHYFQIRIRGHY